MREMHWEFGDLSLTDECAKLAAAHLCDLQRSTFLTAHSWIRIFADLTHPWICRNCGTANNKFDSHCAECQLFRQEFHTSLELSKDSPMFTEVPKPRSTVLHHESKNTAEMVMHVLDKMTAAPTRPQQQCRGCKELQGIVACGKRHSECVVELQAHATVVRGMNACATNRMVQRCGINTLRLIAKALPKKKKAIIDEAKKLNVGSAEAIAKIAFTK